MIIKNIDNQKLIIKNFHNIIKPNQKKIIKGHGMPINNNEFGDLIINFEIDYPDNFSQTIKDKLADLFEYNNKSKYNNTNTNGYVLCDLQDFQEESETEHTEGGERVQCAQQ
jgi:DnaJ-class molecular chaperone